MQFAQCCICIDPLDHGSQDIAAVTCGHTFHAACINSWVARHDTCPQCRFKVSPADVIKLYFCHADGSAGNRIAEAMRKAAKELRQLKMETEDLRTRLLARSQDVNKLSSENATLVQKLAQMAERLRELSGTHQEAVGTIKLLKQQLLTSAQNFTSAGSAETEALRKTVSELRKVLQMAAVNGTSGNSGTPRAGEPHNSSLAYPLRDQVKDCPKPPVVRPATALPTCTTTTTAGNTAANGASTTAQSNVCNTADATPNYYVIIVDGLSPDTSSADLHMLFMKYGKNIVAGVATPARYPVNYGFVSLSSVAETDACIRNLNKTEFQGKIITLQKISSATLRQFRHHGTTRNGTMASSVKDTISAAAQKRPCQEPVAGSSSAAPAQKIANRI